MFYYNWHYEFYFFPAPQPHSDIKRCVQPYMSSLCATVAKQHHRWARAAIEEPDVVKTMYENISSIFFLFCYSPGKCKITYQPQYDAGYRHYITPQ